MVDALQQARLIEWSRCIDAATTPAELQLVTKAIGAVNITLDHEIRILLRLRIKARAKALRFATPVA